MKAKFGHAKVTHNRISIQNRSDKHNLHCILKIWPLKCPIKIRMAFISIFSIFERDCILRQYEYDDGTTRDFFESEVEGI